MILPRQEAIWKTFSTPSGVEYLGDAADQLMLESYHCGIVIAFVPEYLSELFTDIALLFFAAHHLPRVGRVLRAAHRTGFDGHMGL